MPYTEKQRRFFGAELNRKKKGVKGKTEMSKKKLGKLVRSPLEKELSR